MPRAIQLKALDNYHLFVKYDDGVEGVADLSEFAGSGVFSLWNDYNAFRNVHIGPIGELSWSDDVELCGDSIYKRIIGKIAKELLPIDKISRFSGPDRRVETLENFVGFLLENTYSPQDQRKGLALWFRGQPNATDAPIPGALRARFLERVGASHEQEFNEHFRREGASFWRLNQSLVEVYFTAQHHGLPTRLLDWTLNGLTALFFACNKEHGNDGAVFAFVPSCCTYSGFTAVAPDGQKVQAPFGIRSKVVELAIEKLFGDHCADRRPPLLPVVPDLSFDRMSRQQSRFTLHMADDESIPDSLLTKYLIPKEKKSQFLKGLRTLGVTSASLFPDLDHLTQEIRSEWGL
ncbi:MAG: FRG domain-containing protein [Planctomycetales bacterium]